MRTMRLTLDEQERHLLLLALERWRWKIAEDYAGGKPSFMDDGQRMACRYTTARLDELRARIERLGGGAPPSTTTTNE